MTKIIQLTINSCRKCPNSTYSIGGSYTCTKVQGDNHLPDWYAGGEIPRWCPLPDALDATTEAAAPAPAQPTERDLDQTVFLVNAEKFKAFEAALDVPTPTDAPLECEHHFVRDDEHPTHHCCQKCGAVRQDRTAR